MSRGGRRRRDEVPLADAMFLSPSLPARVISPLPSPPELVEDRRSYHPLGMFRPARSFGGLPSPVVIKKAPKARPGRFLPFGLSFAQPDKVALCVRRKTRREVLFAKGKGGGGRRRRPRKNWFSKVSC